MLPWVSYGTNKVYVSYFGAVNTTMYGAPNYSRMTGKFFNSSVVSADGTYGECGDPPKEDEEDPNGEKKDDTKKVGEKPVEEEKKIKECKPKDPKPDGEKKDAESSTEDGDLPDCEPEKKCVEIPKDFDVNDQSNWDKFDFLESTEELNLIRSSIFSSSVRMEYDKDALQDLQSQFKLYHTSKVCPSCYNNWVFDSQKNLDEFMYEGANNTQLYQSEYHKIGEQSIELARVRVHV